MKTYLWQIVSLGSLLFLMVLANSLFIPLVPIIQKELYLTPVDSSLILTVFTIPAVIVIPMIGIFSDRFGRKKMIEFSLLVIVLGTVISIVASHFSSWTLILFGRLLQGIGAGGTTLAMAMAGDLFQGKKLSQGLGALEMFNGFAKVISPMIGGFVALFAWHYSFYLLLVVTVVVLILFRYTMSGRENKTKKLAFKSYLRQFTNVWRKNYPWLLPLFLCTSVGLFVLFGTLFLLTFELEAIYTIHGVEKGFYLAIPFSGLVAFSYITGKTIGTHQEKMKKAMMIGLMLFFAAICCLVFFHNLFSLIFFSTVIASSLGIYLPASNTFVTASVTVYERGVIVSLYNAVRFLGVAFGPIFFGAWMFDLMALFFKTAFIAGVSIVTFMISWNCLSAFVKGAS